MRVVITLGLLGFLAACDAEGDPLRPTASLGVNVGSGGVSQSVTVGAQNSNSSFSVGFGG